MDINLLELLKQQPFTIDDDKDDDNYYITIKCNVDTNNIQYEVIDGQLNITGSNELTQVTNSIYLGSQYSNDDLNVNIKGNKINIVVALKDE